MTIPIYTSLQKRTINFFKKSEEVHHGRWGLSKVVYVSAHKDVIFGCAIHGDYTLSPNDHLKGSGCPECGIITRAENQITKSTKEFEAKANIVHNNFYMYDLVEYKGTYIPVNIRCPEHGIFPQTPNSHLSGSGCNKCGTISTAEKLRSNKEEFEKKSNIVHNNFYIYNLVEYNGSKIEVDIECPDHGVFPQAPNKHLSGQGCPQCTPKGYSKIAIEWLNSISKDIQHAENGGEFKIVKSDGTHFKADGYDSITNTVYEFHGDAWHGNPKLYSNIDKCHPFNKDITAKELYDKTIKRQNEIKTLGYNLVVMWESDYKTI